MARSLLNTMPLLLLAALFAFAPGCGDDIRDPIKEYEDEDLQRNPVKRDILLQFDEIPGVNMRLPAGWHIKEKARTDRWIFEATPYAGEPAYLRLDVIYDRKFQFDDDEVGRKLAVEMTAWHAAADVHGSDSFQVLVDDIIRVHPVRGLPRGIIPGWITCYMDRSDPETNTGPLYVRQVCKLWEKNRAFLFFMNTTERGYREIFNSMFIDFVQSFRSKRALGMEPTPGE